MTNKLVTAISEHQAGRLDVARKIYSTVIEEDQENLIAHHNLGILLFQEKQIEQALFHLKKAHHKFNNDAQYWLSLLKAYLSDQQYEAASDLLKSDLRNKHSDALIKKISEKIDDGLKNSLQIQEKFVDLENSNERIQVEKLINSNLSSSVNRSIENQIEIIKNNFQLGNFEEVISIAKKILFANPTNVFALKALGAALLKTKNPVEALRFNELAVSIEPSDVAANRNLALNYQAIKRESDALLQFKKVLKINTNDYASHNNISVLLRILGKIEEASYHAKRAIEIKPDYFEAFTNLGNACFDKQDLTNAKKNFEQALRINPEFTQALSNLGLVFRTEGDYKKAIHYYKAALKNEPNNFEIISNTGVVYLDVGQYAEALKLFHLALKINPDSSRIYLNISASYREMGELEAAKNAIISALDLDPSYAEAYNNLGIIKMNTMDHDGAELAFREAYRLDPKYSNVLSNLLFLLNYHPTKKIDQIANEYLNLVSAHYPTKPYLKSAFSAPILGRKLRIGYVSADFKKHSIRHFILPVLENHNKQNFELFGYSNLRVEDSWTGRFKSAFDFWRPIIGQSDQAVAELIREDKIDILIDLSGHSFGNRLGVFALRPSKISISAWGYGFTTGLSAINYILTDEVACPEQDEVYFAEKMLKLKTSFIYMPDSDVPECSELPFIKNGYITFLCLSRSVRLNTQLIKAWAEILRQVPGSKLVVNSRDFSSAYMKETLLELFKKNGVESARLEIKYQSPVWEALQTSDIMLDCFPHNSGTTLIESIYMGLPFVTLNSRPLVGKIGASILSKLDLSGLITANSEEYVHAAVKLTKNIPKLFALRRDLRARLKASQFMNYPNFMRDFESRIQNLVDSADDQF
jgi:protein O-GlcNAc transferase